MLPREGRDRGAAYRNVLHKSHSTAKIYITQQIQVHRHIYIYVYVSVPIRMCICVVFGPDSPARSLAGCGSLDARRLWPQPDTTTSPATLPLPSTPHPTLCCLCNRKYGKKCNAKTFSVAAAAAAASSSFPAA